MTTPPGQHDEKGRPMTYWGGKPEQPNAARQEKSQKDSELGTGLDPASPAGAAPDPQEARAMSDSVSNSTNADAGPVERRARPHDPEVRLNEDGTLDEVIGFGAIHMEQMDANHWWLRIDCVGGGAVVVNLIARGKISAHHEREPAGFMTGPKTEGTTQTSAATLHLDSWAGRRTYRIRIIGETRDNYRFEALEDIPMPKRKWLKAGEHGRAPKKAVTPNCEIQGAPEGVGPGMES